MNESKIFIPESSSEGADLFDGFILSLYHYEDNFKFEKIDKDVLLNIYTRLLHYADVMKYENKPGEDLWKYTEARGLAEKLGECINEEEFRYMADECALWLS
jgi:hypothetical protein